MSCRIDFDYPLFRHAEQELVGPIGIFAISFFTASPAADFASGNKLAREGFEEGADVLLV